MDVFASGTVLISEVGGLVRIYAKLSSVDTILLHGISTAC